MITERMISLLRDYNPWWEGKEVSVPVYKRHAFEQITKYIKTKQIIAVVGLRRVGKTVLLKQILSGLDVGKKNLCYFLFDELIAQNPDALEDLLDYYLKTIAGEGKKYIFLDEIQKVPYWQDVLKRLYDTRDDIKFLVSGSASLHITKSKESLAGRIFDFYMPILTFREFLELNNTATEKADANNFQAIYEKNINKQQFFNDMFLQYLFRGAFPEMAKEHDEDIIKNYVKSSVIEKIILEDIPTVFHVKKKDLLSSILEYCSRETSTILDIKNLSKILATNYLTVRSYVFYLKNSFVIDIANNYSKGAAKQLRKNKKVHIAHPSISAAMMGYKTDIMKTETVSKYVETAVFQHAKIISENISFWRTPQKEEVDIVADGMPIEVKYKESITDSDTKSLEKFMKEFGAKTGILVTKNLLGVKKAGVDGKIIMVPAWLYCWIV